MTTKFDLSKYIVPIELNGLKGRMVEAPTTAKKKDLNILFIHGSHSAQERLSGVAELMQQFGNVCMPDLPGHGGMDHFYSIGEKPSIENYADYLAGFIKLHYGKRKKFVVVGYSFGFIVVTRMLQKYPDLHKQILDVISIAGTVHGDELRFSKTRKFWYTLVLNFLSWPLSSWVMREVFLRRWCLGSFYTKTYNAKEKFAGLDKAAKRHAVDFEVMLWRVNHIPTWCVTSLAIMYGDLVTGASQMPLNLISIVVDNDRYFHGDVCEQHFKMLYKKVTTERADVASHGGATVDTVEQAQGFLTKRVRAHLRSLQ
jgi:pimeloyl-ACP methyl ester carboxylesterase